MRQRGTIGYTAGCEPCRVTYYYDKDFSNFLTVWYCVENDVILYRVKIYHIRADRSYPIFRVTKGIPSRFILKFDFIPADWTPQNALHKIRTYLPFL